MKTEFIKYFLVGGFAACIDIATFALLTMAFGVGHLVANTIAITLGLIVCYHLSCRWVFGQKKINIRRDFIPFAVIGFVGLGIQNVLLYGLIDLQIAFSLAAIATALTGMSIGNGVITLGSKIFGVGVTFVWNFIVRKYLVFERAKRKEQKNERKSGGLDSSR
jgi:putative flippase GtrA